MIGIEIVRYCFKVHELLHYNSIFLQNVKSCNVDIGVNILQTYSNTYEKIKFTKIMVYKNVSNESW